MFGLLSGLRAKEEGFGLFQSFVCFLPRQHGLINSTYEKLLFRRF